MLELPEQMLRSITNFCNFFDVLVLKGVCKKFNSFFSHYPSLVEWTTQARYDFPLIRLNDSKEKTESEVLNQEKYLKKKLLAYLYKPNVHYLNKVSKQLSEYMGDSAFSSKKLIKGFYQNADENVQHESILEIATFSTKYPELAQFMKDFRIFCGLTSDAKSWGGYTVAEKLSIKP